MRAVFLMMKVEPGTLAEVADRVTDLESFSEAYSISGAYDLLVKLYVDDFEDLSHLVTEQIQKIPHVRETFTILVEGRRIRSPRLCEAAQSLPHQPPALSKSRPYAGLSPRSACECWPGSGSASLANQGSG